MFFKYLMTILLSAGFLLPGFSQYSAKVMVSIDLNNSLIISYNFVIRKQCLAQDWTKVAANGRFELRSLTAGRFPLLRSDDRQSIGGCQCSFTVIKRYFMLGLT